MSDWIRAFAFLMASIVPQTGTTRPVTASETPAISPAIVIGFVGGFVGHENLIHAEVQVAVRLRQEYSSGVSVETFENYRGAKARRRILQLLDANHDGRLTPDEKQSARIIIYGHSWGASEGIALARKLAGDGIPVLFTIQVDSIAKIGQNDTIISANVAQAVNFYQTKGLLHGRDNIRAADPSRTQIIGNFRYDYELHPLSCDQYPWWDRVLVKAHTEIECDPKVWDRVEALIRSKLPEVAQHSLAR